MGHNVFDLVVGHTYVDTHTHIPPSQADAKCTALLQGGGCARMSRSGTVCGETGSCHGDASDAKLQAEKGRWAEGSHKQKPTNLRAQKINFK